jgi:amino acid permease
MQTLPEPSTDFSTDSPSVASTIGKAAIVVLVMFSYPLQVHPCRASVDAVLKWRPQTHTEADGSPARGPLLPNGKKAGKPGSDGISDVRFAAITTVIIVMSYIVAMTVSSLSTVLAYVGSTGSTAISFILPGLFYYKISSPDSPLHQKLVKEDDDGFGDSSDDDDDDEEDNGLLGNRGSTTMQAWRKRFVKKASHGLMRKLSLALAIYGVVVMVTCLGTNTFLAVSSH